MAWAAGATALAISARCRFIASLLQAGDQGRALALLGADRAEDIGGSGTLVARRTGAGAALRPAASDFVLLADAGLVGEPDFYCIAVDALLARDRLQTGGEAFLKSSIAPAA